MLRVWAQCLLVAGLTLCPAPSVARSVEPPPVSFEFMQYGVGLVAETVASGGDVCAHSERTPCIIGSGFGPTIRIGYRSRGPWYVGGAYQFSRQNSSNLLRLAILQQLRAESRYYFDYGDRLAPYGIASIGATAYGNEWGIATGGLVASLGAGFEFQLSEGTVVGGAAGYRLLVLRRWDDATGQRRADRYLGFGFAHLVGFELNWEIRDPLPRW